LKIDNQENIYGDEIVGAKWYQSSEKTEDLSFP